MKWRSFYPRFRFIIDFLKNKCYNIFIRNKERSKAKQTYENFYIYLVQK